MKEISFDLMGKLKALFSADKKRALAIVAAVCGILLILLSFGNNKNNSEINEVGYSEAELEESVAELLSSIDGVGRCKVKISFSSGERLEYKNGNLVYKEPARVSGVSVVCEGGGNSSVVRAISDTVSSLFDIGTNRISVQKMK